MVGSKSLFMLPIQDRHNIYIIIYICTWLNYSDVMMSASTCSFSQGVFSCQIFWHSRRFNPLDARGINIPLWLSKELPKLGVWSQGWLERGHGWHGLWWVMYGYVGVTLRALQCIYRDRIGLQFEYSSNPVEEVEEIWDKDRSEIIIKPEMFGQKTSL